MEELMEILEDIRDDVDFSTETSLIDDKILSSFDILSILSELSAAPENFNSAQAMWAMITRLREGK